MIRHFGRRYNFIAMPNVVFVCLFDLSICLKTKALGRMSKG